MTNREKARAYFTAVNQYDAAAVEAMVEEDYIQHNPFVPTGRAAFLSLLPKLKQHGSQIHNARIVHDGHFVAMHHHWTNATPFGKDEMVAFHVIRFNASGRIAEHWNVNGEKCGPNPSGRSLIDGATTIEDLEKTQANKAIIAELFRGLTTHLTPTDFLPLFFQKEFRQHHPAVADGHEGYVRAQRKGVLSVVYERQHIIIGEGNFVLSVSEGRQFETPMALYDLFRLEQEKIAEQWNVYQAIPLTGLANQNTMFHFFG